MGFNNLKIRTKILLTFLAFILLMTIIGIYGFITIRNSEKFIDNLIKNRIIKLELIRSTGVDLHQQLIAERQIFMTDISDTTAINKSLKTYTKNIKQAEKRMKEVKQMQLDKEEKRLFKLYDSLRTIWLPASQELIEDYLQNPEKKEEIIKASMGDVYAKFDTTESTLDDLGDYNREISFTLRDNQMKRQRKILTMMILTIIISVIVAIAILYSLLSDIRKSLRTANATVKKIASGDLMTEINIHKKDELGELLSNLNFMIVKLREVLNNTSGFINEIQETSTFLKETSESLASNASEEAASAEEISASMENIAETMQKNANNAKETADFTKITMNELNKGRDAMLKNMKAIDEINSKISIIAEIAGKIDILAINAAIEAARAGEKGKGFAVVANEVRTLSDRSRIASEQIFTALEHTKQVSSDLANIIADLKPAFDKTYQLISEIKDISISQASSTTEMDSSIQQLNNTAQLTANSSENLANIAKKMSSQIDKLSDMISFFKVK